MKWVNEYTYIYYPTYSGLVHSRRENWTPPPQGREQVPQASHALHPPWMGGITSPFGRH